MNRRPKTIWLREGVTLTNRDALLAAGYTIHATHLADLTPRSSTTASYVMTGCHPGDPEPVVEAGQ